MKCQIKTAHGYLSFQPSFPQPDGVATVQYRQTAGPWEEIEIIGWEMPVTPPEPAPGPDPLYDWPGGIPPSESSAYVSAIKDWLVSEGENLQGPCGAFLIVANVAWGCQSLATGCGLLSKPDGNNCMAYSTDVVAYKDFSEGSTRIVDILGDAGGENNPTWQEKDSDENVDMDRWRPPIDPDTVTRTQAARKRR